MLINYIRSQCEALARLFWDVCARVLRCFIWFSAQSYPIITVCAQPMNTAFCFINTNVCMYVWAPLEDRGGAAVEGGGVGAPWQSDKLWDKRCGKSALLTWKNSFQLQMSSTAQQRRNATALYQMECWKGRRVQYIKRMRHKNSNLLLWFAWRLW